jgi:hypothetical protein
MIWTGAVIMLISMQEKSSDDLLMKVEMPIMYDVPTARKASDAQVGVFAPVPELLVASLHYKLESKDGRLNCIRIEHGTVYTDSLPSASSVIVKRQDTTWSFHYLGSQTGIIAKLPKMPNAEEKSKLLWSALVPKGEVFEGLLDSRLVETYELEIIHPLHSSAIYTIRESKRVLQRGDQTLDVLCREWYERGMIKAQEDVKRYSQTFVDGQLVHTNFIIRQGRPINSDQALSASHMEQ